LQRVGFLRQRKHRLRGCAPALAPVAPPGIERQHAVAGASTGALAGAVAPGGTVVIYGVLSGGAASFDAADVLFRNVAVRGFWFSAWFSGADAAERKALYDTLAPLLADGTLAVPVEAVYPLAEVRAALAHAARPGRRGKILLAMNETATIR
jgi:NADPH:quinone reductase-like Zn-dependent oxidoreductase